MTTFGTTEWEFQGEALTWISDELRAHNLGFDRATQEFKNPDGHRSDIVIWRNRALGDAVLEIELKPPSVSLSDEAFQRDAVRKAQLVGAPYLALWNVTVAHCFRTPAPPRKDLLPDDFIAEVGRVSQARSIEDCLKPTVRESLRRVALELVRAAYDLSTHGSVGGQLVDATVFVDFLGDRVRSLRTAIEDDFRKKLAADRAIRRRISLWAAKQGLAAFVEDLHSALAAQMSYRLVGQILFYHSYRRHEPSLPKLQISPGSSVTTQLRAFWDAVRAFDYEALYEQSPLEEIPLGPASESQIANLVADLSAYSWDKVRDDVLGSVFENMIPTSERIILGQYYTKPQLADLMVSLCMSRPEDLVFDPGVGTGTFLMRAHQRIRQSSTLSHEEILENLWAVDISAFPAELAVLNLCRQDLTSADNFPRVAVRDFFTLKPGDTLTFPPAKRHRGSTHQVQLPLPAFDCVIGNPPYVRSQQLDDLEPTYKAQLHRLAHRAGVAQDSKFDAYAYYFIHAASFVKEGGRIGFVTSAAWLTSKYGATLQRFMLDYFQPVLVIWSEVEPFFPNQDVDTVVTILERLDQAVRKEPGVDPLSLTP